MPTPWAALCAARRATSVLASTSGRLSGSAARGLASTAGFAPAAAGAPSMACSSAAFSTAAPSFAPSALVVRGPWAPVVRLNGRQAIHTSSFAADGAQPGALTPPAKTFVRLNTLAPAPGSTRPAKRVGRGIGSGRGKTSTRGHKGQKARSGATPKLGFEGGQTPLGKRLPKRGFVSPTAVVYTPVNVGRLQALVEAGRLDAGKTVTMRDLVAAGAVSKKAKHGVKLLGRGELKTRLSLEVSAVSPAAKAAVEAAGGSVTTVYYNGLNLRALLRPGWLAKVGRAQPRPARPPPKRAGLFDKVGVVPPDGGGVSVGQAAAAAVA